MRARVVCIGNPWHPDDWVGPAVFADLRGRGGEDVGIVDGGLRGLDLLPLLENVERVVFADTLRQVDAGVTVLAEPQPASAAIRFDHGGGLAALLAAAPLVLERLPRIWLVGARADSPPDLLPVLGDTCLRLARGQFAEASHA